MFRNRIIFSGIQNFREKDKLCKNGSIILKNVNDPDKNSTGNVIERIKSFTGGAERC